MKKLKEPRVVNVGFTFTSRGERVEVVRDLKLVKAQLRAAAAARKQKTQNE